MIKRYRALMTVQIGVFKTSILQAFDHITYSLTKNLSAILTFYEMLSVCRDGLKVYRKVSN